MAPIYRPFLPVDYDAAYSLWSATEGIGLSEADSRENIERFLRHNPGLSFVAVNGEADGEAGTAGSGSALAGSTLAGAVLASCDGRRGYLHHLAVAPAYRRRGVGRGLVERCLAALAEAGMRKCHIFVVADNAEGKRFWQRIGWEERTSLIIMSKDVRPPAQ
jgi:ribosomal protein S18 acetylase RimI-like enzyme